MRSFSSLKKKSWESYLSPLWVFDFDRTITKLHTGGCVTIEKTRQEHVLNNVKEGFKEFIFYLFDRGSKIYIATYGDDSFGNQSPYKVAGHSLIKCYMDVIFGDNQNLFTLPLRDKTNRILSYGNIIAKFSQDGKKYHLQQILEKENLSLENSSEMKTILLIDDDVENLRFFQRQGCAILVPESCENSARLAQNRQLFVLLQKWVLR